MNERWKILTLLAVFVCGGLIVNPVMARRYDTGLIAYDRWITEDYRYQNADMREAEAVESTGFTDPEFLSGVEDTMDFSGGGNFDPIGAIFGAIGWIGESIGSVFGVQADDPYDANP